MRADNVVQRYLITGWPSLVTPYALVPCFLRPVWRGIFAPSPFSSASLRSRGFPRPKGQENCGTYAGRSKGRPPSDQIRSEFTENLNSEPVNVYRNNLPWELLASNYTSLLRSMNGNDIALYPNRIL
jgi:hypothetical protein